MKELRNENKENLKYEYLIVDATVVNRTNWCMMITGSNLSWGKWDTSPVNVMPQKEMKFLCRGRSDSPSGTEGWATWVLEGHPKSPEIKITFDNPAVGSDKVSITCDPKDVVAISANQSKGKHNCVTYIIG